MERVDALTMCKMIQSQVKNIIRYRFDFTLSLDKEIELLENISDDPDWHCIVTRIEVDCTRWKQVLSCLVIPSAVSWHLDQITLEGDSGEFALQAHLQE